MSDQLLLDTHIALWLDSGHPKLQASTRSCIDACWRQGGTLLFSAVSAWEIAAWVDRGHIELDLSVNAWVERYLQQPGPGHGEDA